MSIENTPWVIAGGAMHSPSLARSVAHMALGGREGVASAGDLAVRALATPGSSVRVDKGVFAILNTYASEFGQMYVGRAPSETISPVFAPTGATGRSDLLVLRIDDPEFGGTPVVDPLTGNYQRLEIISNVGSSATDVPNGTGYPAIPLARIDMPAGTTNITQAMIKDLRSLPAPRRSSETLYYQPTTQQDLDVTTTAGEKWPNPAGWNVSVPDWATAVHMVVTVSGLVTLDNATGKLWGQFGEYGTPNAIATPEIGYNSAETTTRNTYSFGSKLSIAAALRGTAVNVAVRGRKATGVNPYADIATSVLVTLTFVEEPVVS